MNDIPRKGLFKVKEPVLSSVLERSNQYSVYESREQREPNRDLEHEGFMRAGQMKGSRDGLAICLNHIYQRYKGDEKKDIKSQEERLRPLRVKLKEHEGNIERLQDTLRNHKETKIPAVKARIEEIRKEITVIKEDPEGMVGQRPARASFLVGVLILLCLSLYLFIFYSSASYSAFFKQFTLSEIGVANSIFDAQALSKALTDGVTELGLIVMMPFVFLGLGFLIHKFQQVQGAARYFKVAVLLAVTFIFDAILAYEITSKIKQIKAISSFEEPSPYYLLDAFGNVQFWLIIFAGFLVYIVWGFVFDFVVAEHDKLDAVSMAVKHKREEIKAERDKIADLETQIDKMNQAIHNYQTEAEKLKQIINNTVFLPPEKFEALISEFMTGWIHWMTANKFSDAAVAEARATSDQFLANLSPDQDSLGGPKHSLSKV